MGAIGSGVYRHDEDRPGSGETRWLDVVAWTIKAEGGARLTVDPDDPGGATFAGISQRYHPRVDVARLTLEGAVAIYRAEYWEILRLGELPAILAAAAFECAVLPGQRFAALRLQGVLGVPADGRVGPVTIARAWAVEAALAAEHLLDERAAYFYQAAQRRPKSRKYLRGWIARNARLRSWLRESFT